MRRRAPPADEHSELSSAVLRLTTQWELKVDGWARKAAREREKLRFKPHEVLGLESPRPSEDEVKRAYRKMSIKWHPDRHAAASDEHKHRAHLQFQRISAANDALEKRAADPYRPYDWAPHRYDDDDDDDDDDGHSDDDDDDDDDDAEFDRARRAWGSSRDQSDSWSEYFRQKRA